MNADCLDYTKYKLDRDNFSFFFKLRLLSAFITNLVLLKIEARSKKEGKTGITERTQSWIATLQLTILPIYPSLDWKLQITKSLNFDDGFNKESFTRKVYIHT